MLESGKIKYEIDCYKPALGLLVSKILMNIILIIIYNICVPFVLLVFKNIQQKRSFPQFFILDIVFWFCLKSIFKARMNIALLHEKSNLCTDYLS